METIVNIHAAKTHLSKLLQQVMAGEEIVIAKSGKPIARIIPFEPQPKQRTPGSAVDKIWIALDFNDPLPDEILDAFEGTDSSR